MKQYFTFVAQSSKPTSNIMKTAKQTFLVLGSALLVSLQVQAQFSNYKAPMQDTRGSSVVNLNLGGTVFLGDLGGTGGQGEKGAKDLNLETTRPFLGASYTYYPANWWSVTGGINFTWVTGADSLIDQKIGNAAGRYERNLSFRSPITEVQVGAEVYPLQLLTANQLRETKFRPYIGAGIGAFHFNPKAKLNGTWYALRPLHTEGQGFLEYPERKNYKLDQIYIPVSLGVRYRINNNYFVSLSATFRRTFTDYIDDVSTSYIDPALFNKYYPLSKASLARALNYRGPDSETSQQGIQRGEPGKDSYTSVFFTISYLFNNKDAQQY